MTVNGVAISSGATVAEGTEISIEYGYYNTAYLESYLYINGELVGTSTGSTLTYTTTVTSDMVITCD